MHIRDHSTWRKSGFAPSDSTVHLTIAASTPPPQAAKVVLLSRVTLHDSSCKSVSSSAAPRSALPRGLWTSQHTFHVCSENTLLGNLSESSPSKSRLKGLETRGHRLSVHKLALGNQSKEIKEKSRRSIGNQSATNGNATKSKKG